MHLGVDQDVVFGRIHPHHVGHRVARGEPDCESGEVRGLPERANLRVDAAHWSYCGVP